MFVEYKKSVHFNYEAATSQTLLATGISYQDFLFKEINI